MTAGGGVHLPRPWNAAEPLTIETYEGSGATVHPSVVDMGPGGWRGYRYWLADTPYAPIPGNPSAGDNQTENPAIWAGHAPDAFEVPTGTVNPLSPAPGMLVGFHSDTDLVYDPEGDRMIMYFRRALFVGGDTEIYIRALVCEDGISWVDEGVVLEVPLNGGRLSPAVLREADGTWSMWVWGDAVTVVRYSAPDPLGPWTDPTDVTLDSAPLLGWHGDVIHDGTRYLMAYSNRDLTEFRGAWSTDGIHWTPSRTPVLMERRLDDWETSLYRPSLSMSPTTGVIDCWYSAISPMTTGFAIGYTRIPHGAML